jgi:predicted PurR-regulated permease PerM
MLNHKHKFSSVVVVVVVVVVMVMVAVAVMVVMMTQNVRQISQNMFSKILKYCTLSKHVYKEKQNNY